MKKLGLIEKEKALNEIQKHLDLLNGSEYQIRYTRSGLAELYGEPILTVVAIEIAENFGLKIRHIRVEDNNPIVLFDWIEYRGMKKE